MKFFILALVIAASLAALANSLPEIKSVLPKDLSAKELRSSAEKISDLAKEQIHGLQSFLTTDPVEKVELELRYAAERLRELEKVSSNRTAGKKAIEQKLENYAEARKRLEKSLERLEESGKLSNGKIPAEKPALPLELKPDEKLADKELKDKINQEKGIQREVEQELSKLKKDIGTKARQTPRPTAHSAPSGKAGEPTR